MTSTEIRLALLDILNEALPYAVPEETLMRNLNARVRPEIGQAELDVHLLFLKDHDLIKALAGQLGDLNVRWLITEAGQGERMR